jgi:hypothetical protein
MWKRKSILSLAYGDATKMASLRLVARMFILALVAETMLASFAFSGCQMILGRLFRANL